MIDAEATEMATTWIANAFDVSRDEALRRLIIGTAKLVNGELRFEYIAEVKTPERYVGSLGA